MQKDTKEKDAQNKSKREINAEQRREAIIAAALDEFMQYGFEGARTDRIARAAKVGKGTLFLYFPDKESMFEGVIMHTVRPLKEHVAAMLEAGKQKRDLDLRGIVLTLPAFVQHGGILDVFGLFLREGIRFPRLVQFYYREVIGPMLQIVSGPLHEAAEQGGLRDKRIAEYPQLLFAPAIFWMMWNTLFGEQLKLNLDELMDIQFSCYLTQGKTLKF